MNKNRLLPLIATTLAGSLILSWGQFSIAAKKYYPPGYNPPPDSNVEDPQPRVETTTQTIIKTVRVPVPAKPKPKDQLEALIEEQRFTEALRVADQRIKHAPWNYSLKLTRAQILRQKQSYEVAKAEYNAIYAKSKNKSLQSQAKVGLGLTQLDQSLQSRKIGDTHAAEALLNEAELSFKQALKLNPKMARAWNGLAGIDLVRGNITEAEHSVEQATKTAPNDTQVLLTRSRLLLALKKPEEALHYIFKAKQQSPKDPEMNLLLGQSYYALQRYDDAIIQLQQVLDKAPDNTEALKLMSAAYDHKMKPEDAETALQRAVSLNPGDVEAAMSLMKIYDQRGETQRSILLLKTLIKDEPAAMPYTVELVKRLAQAGDWDAVYQQGSRLLTALPALPDSSASGLEPTMQTLTQAVFIRGKGVLDRQAFLQSPEVKALQNYFRNKLSQTEPKLSDRLCLLMLDPLADIPALDLASISAKDFPVALEISFLQGNWTQHKQYLSLVLNDTTLSAEERLQTARDLLLMGDFSTAQTLVEGLFKQDPDREDAVQLAMEISKTRRKAEEQIRGLQMLPSRIPRSHWEDTAKEALTLSGGNAELYAVLADFLMDHRDYDLALVQQKLAAQYAQSERERNKWLKRAEKTEEKLAKLRDR